MTAENPNTSALHDLNNDIGKFQQRLESGLDPNTIVDDLPLIWHAVRSNDSTAVEMLIKFKANIHSYSDSGISLLGYACSRPDSKIPEILLKAGANPNDGDILHRAIYYGLSEIAQLLIQYGADLDAKGFGKTPLFIAAQTGQIEIAKTLLYNGADYTIKSDILSVTPSDVVRFTGQTNEIRTLLGGFENPEHG